jgi:NADH-quinone oxidoreductase subunit N
VADGEDEPAVTLGNVQSLSHFLPESLIVLTILLVLIVDLAGRGRRPGLNAGVAVAGLAAAFAAAIAQTGAQSAYLFEGMITLDPFAIFYKLFFIAVGAVVVMIAHPYKELTAEYHGESYAMILGVVLGMMLLASASNLLMIYLALETVSLPSYLLTGILRRDSKSSEAGLKYVLFGAAASGCMVYGMSLFYGMTQTLNLAEMRAVLAVADVPTFALFVATAFVLAGFGFKIAMVPFHMWAPDVYEGASTPVTAFLSVAPKAAGLAVLLRFFFSGLTTQQGGVLQPFYGLDWPFLLAVLSAVTMTLGNLAAIRQNNLKRLLAYSSIAHAGYLLMGAVLLTADGIKAITFYLVVYGLMNLGAFLVVIAMSVDGRREEFESYRGLGWRTPILAIPMAIFMFSLTGVPPFAGFIGKFYLFKAVVERNFYWLALIGVLNSVVSLYYYMRIVKTMYLDDPAPGPAERVRVPLLHAIVIVALAVPTVVFGFAFGWLERLSSYSLHIFSGS